MNRILEAVRLNRLNIERRLDEGVVDQEELDRLHSSLDMPMDEYSRFQDMKSLAVLAGVFSQDEGMTLYGYLGEVPYHFNEQPLEVKLVVTQVFKELLGRRIMRGLTVGA